MPRKTSKTSHVLNLITNGAAEAEEAQGAPQEAAKETKDAPAAEPQKTAQENKVIVVNETSENEKLSNEIKSRLEAQLEAEVAEARAAEQMDAVTELAAEAVKENDTEAQIRPVPEPQATVQAAQPVSEVQASAPSSAAQPVLMRAAAAGGDDVGVREAPREPVYRMLNVMERILSNTDVVGQMKQYGVCLCSRCRADVQALVLTNLPSKYVIIDSTPTSPIIGYYEGNYRIKIAAEIAKACIKVKERPRH